jgi:hypothetical protein
MQVYTQNTAYRLLILVLFSLYSFAIQATDTSLHIYKDPNCGCCSKWIDHLQSEGFETAFTDTSQLDVVKKKYGIGTQYRSCHTAVSVDGYIFEGHIPAGVIQRFLDEKPANAIGLSVPGMPVGSPGMEVGSKFMPYQVLLLKKDGSTEVYADISRPEMQYSVQ